MAEKWNLYLVEQFTRSILDKIDQVWSESEPTLLLTQPLFINLLYIQQYWNENWELGSFSSLVSSPSLVSYFCFLTSISSQVSRFFYSVLTGSRNLYSILPAEFLYHHVILASEFLPIIWGSLSCQVSVQYFFWLNTTKYGVREIFNITLPHAKPTSNQTI